MIVSLNYYTFDTLIIMYRWVSNCLFSFIWFYC